MTSARRSRWVLVLALLAAAACSDDGGGPDQGARPRALCKPGRPSSAGTVERVLPHGGLERRYALSIPDGYDGRRPAPLVVNLHGFGGSGAAQNSDTDLPDLAGARGYIIVAPDGGPLKVPIGIVPGAERAGQYEDQPFWNVFGPGAVDFGPPNGQNLGIDSSAIGADDVSFVSALLDVLERDLCIDPNRIYATGMSNGAGMSTMLGCALGDRFAAIAPVSGVNLTGKCPGSAPVSVRAVHGAADDTVLYGGNGLLGFQFGNPSVADRMAQWAQRGGCEATPETEQREPDLKIERWRGCRVGVDVELWTIAGWGHEWPRASSTEEPGVIDATDVVLDFFDRHARSNGAPR